MKRQSAGWDVIFVFWAVCLGIAITVVAIWAQQPSPPMTKEAIELQLEEARSRQCRSDLAGLYEKFILLQKEKAELEVKINGTGK